MEFTAGLEATGGTTTGFVVPDEAVPATKQPETRERRGATIVAGLG